MVFSLKTYRYTIRQVLAVVMVSVGLFLATHSHSTTEQAGDTTMLVGVALLTIALVLSTFLGFLQDHAYSTYGRSHYQEGMFYTHMLALPLFIFLWRDLLEHVHSWNTRADLLSTTTLQGVSIQVPIMWIFLSINVFTQLICVTGVFSFISKTNALTCTFTLSVRKFLSLLISVLYFGNAFTARHWVSTFLVFSGSLLYATSPRTVSKSDKSKQWKSS